MNEGDFALAHAPQADGGDKLRPVLLLRELPGFGDYLVCGVSTQLKQEVRGFDLPLLCTSPDFANAGLKHPSLVRLNFLAVLPRKQLIGKLGTLSRENLQLLQQRLSDHLVK